MCNHYFIYSKRFPDDDNYVVSSSLYRIERFTLHTLTDLFIANQREFYGKHWAMLPLLGENF